LKHTEKKSQILLISQKSKSQKNCFLCWNKTKVRSSQSGAVILRFQLRQFLEKLEQIRSKFLPFISHFLSCKKIIYFQFVSASFPASNGIDK